MKSSGDFINDLVERTAVAKRVARYRRTLVAYLEEKVVQEDWRGVSDAANDLRELDARMREREAAK